MIQLNKIFSIFLLLFLSVSFSAQNYYDVQWKKIEQNATDGQFKSNLPIILEIQNQAMKENNLVEIVKSLRAEFAIVSQTQDDTQNNATSEFFAKLQNTEAKIKSNEKVVFRAFSIMFLRDYFEQNQWKLRNRTNLENGDLSQIETWSSLDFKNYFTQSFSKLEKQKSVLQKAPLSKYKEIFDNTEDISYFPTIQDWLTLQEIDILQDGTLFTPNELQENKEKILQLYNNEIANNQGNPRIYFQLQKTNYLNSEENWENKKYTEELGKIANSDTKGDYKLFVTDKWASSMSSENPKEALAILEKAKNTYPESKFHNNIENTRNGIIKSRISLNYENYPLPNRPIPLFLEYKNASQFELKIYRVTQIDPFIDYLKSSYENPLNKVPKELVRSETFQLKNPGDYQNHSSMVSMKALNKGLYIVEYLANGEAEDFFWISVNDSRIIYKNRDQQKNEYLLVNAENGAIDSTKKLLFYDYSDFKKKPIITPLTLGENGNFFFPEANPDKYRYFIVVDSENQSIINTDDLDRIVRRIEPNDETRNVATILTDRGIYRPGQTVYFKVINITGNSKGERVAAGLKQQIVLYDANRKEIGRQSFTTNEFGSYSGSFILPKGQLNGMFYLSTDDYTGSKNIQVEEYKRPNFEVNFEDLKDEYKFGQTVQLKGKAVSYSGVPLSNATVNYEIKQQDIRYRYFYWYSSNANVNSILGTATTNEKGEFSIPVELKKDPSQTGIQIQEYSINAAVTDLNGESQENTTHFRVASVSHYISANSIGTSFSEDLIKIEVKTKNYSDQDLDKTYHARLSKLETPSQIFRNTFRSKIQDMPLLSKEEFTADFPHDYYDKSELPENWKAAQVIFDKVEPTKDFNLGKLDAGNYRLEFYNIEGQDTIRAQQDFTILDKNKASENLHPFLIVKPNKKEYSRGEIAEVYIYSSIPDAKVYLYTQKEKDKTDFEEKTISNGWLVYQVKIPTDKTQKRVNLQILLPAFNDIESANLTLPIQDESQPMELELTTFRDKIQPGSKEKWTLKVSGENSPKSTSEVLANMYDQSLDQFASNHFNLQRIPKYTFSAISYLIHPESLGAYYYSQNFEYSPYRNITVPTFNWFDYHLVVQAYGTLRNAEVPLMEAPQADSMSMARPEIQEVIISRSGDQQMKKESEAGLENVPLRKNLQETAFFYPNLVTDKEGNVQFEFTSPEALTKWKLMFLAHDQQGNYATLNQSIITQKDFSVTPNYPRFLREGDEFILQTKLNNLVDKELSGNVKLEILDAFTEEDISSKFQLEKATQSFSLPANSSGSAQWKIKTPKDISGIIIRIVAKAGKYSDGEQKDIPVLSNRMLVTDAVPIFVKEGETKTFTLENLKNNTSTTVENFSNTLELTTNPIWEVIFSLPSLKNDPNQSADVFFNKWFADVLASEIYKANPRLKKVFEEYQDKGLLESNLEQNQELKQLLLEETPWVLDSENETEQMQKIARLFDANTMRNSVLSDWENLLKMQNGDGGFSWTPGGPSSFFTSLYILENLGKINEWLSSQNALSDYQSTSQETMVKNLTGYLDRKISDYWNVKYEPWSNLVLNYLDARHYWESKYPIKGVGVQLKSEVKAKVKNADISEFTFYGLSRMALLMDHYGLKDVSDKLLTFLKETSTETKTQGVYWKQNLNDWGWYSSKTINQALTLQAFNQLKPTDPIVEEAKIWLITQKHVNHWNTSRATAEVIYTILNSGKPWTSAESDKANVVWGGKTLTQPDTEATGYIKDAVKSTTIDKNLSTVTITQPSAGIVQGGIYWQYYEDLDKIKSSESYISLSKELYKKVKTENGEELKPITSSTPLKVGDRVTVRMILNTDRPMEFIHIKDMRAAGFEPVDVISGYRWKNNLGFYQSTKDASTNFYIEQMPKGKYVFEYDLVANAAGTFSNGITTMQNYYAPEMNAHSEGSSVNIQ